MSNQSANDLIMGGGSPAAKFPEIGTIVRGEIIDTAVTQQRDFATGDLKFWKDGNPAMQAVITLQTDQRDPIEIADDNGQRRLFVSSKNMREAIRDAVRKVGGSHLEVGGQLAVQYHGDGQAERGMNPPKLYKAEYKPAPQGVATSDLLGGDESPF